MVVTGRGMAERLAGLDDAIGKAMESWRVPGSAVAIVHDQDVLYSKGFGVRGTAPRLPVTPHTLFPIGSCAKSFVSFAIGLLVDEGRLDWDTPIRSYVPDFQMVDPHATARLTIRDILSHRTGLCFNNLFLRFAPFTREQIFRRLRHLECLETYNVTYNYSNVMYAVAEYIIERLAGTTCEDFIRTRIFDRLSMHDSSFTFEELAKDTNHSSAFGYRDSRVVEAPVPSLRPGHVFSVNSNIVDLSKWIMVHIGGGECDGDQCISVDALSQIHLPHALMPSRSAAYHPEKSWKLYCLGWIIQSYRGHSIISHHGTLEGYYNYVAVMPQDKLGMVILCNMQTDGFVKALVYNIADRLLGYEATDWDGRYKHLAVESAIRRSRYRRLKRSVVDQNGNPSIPGSYAGRYMNKGYGDLSISMADGQMLLRYYSLEVRLEPSGGNTFVAFPDDRDVSEVTVDFHSGSGTEADALDLSVSATGNRIRFTRS